MGKESTRAAPRPRANRGKRTEECEKRELVRGEPVVQRVLDATIAEMARVGYRALRIEDVAARAGVNKTTVYRRWPEKGALLREALAAMGKALHGRIAVQAKPVTGGPRRSATSHHAAAAGEGTLPW